MMDDVQLTLLMADIDEVLSQHKASVEDVMAAGIQMIYSAFGQVVDENPTADLEELARMIANTLHLQLRQRISSPPPPMAEA